MTRFAKIDTATSVVVNVEEWGQEPAQAGFVYVASETANRDDVWDGEVFSTPEPIPAVPDRVSRLQAKLVLHNAGQLAAVSAQVAAANDEGFSLYYNEASDWHRNHFAVAAIAYGMGWDSAYLDALFIEAATIL